MKSYKRSKKAPQGSVAYPGQYDEMLILTMFDEWIRGCGVAERALEIQGFIVSLAVIMGLHDGDAGAVRL